MILIILTLLMVDVDSERMKRTREEKAEREPQGGWGILEEKGIRSLLS